MSQLLTRADNDYKADYEARGYYETKYASVKAEIARIKRQLATVEEYMIYDNIHRAQGEMCKAETMCRELSSELLTIIEKEI